MTATTAERAHPVPGRRFQPTEPVFEGLEEGPKFGQDVWNLRAAITARSTNDRNLNLGSIQPQYREDARELLMAKAQPLHPAVIAAGVVVRPEPAQPTQLLGIASRFSAMSAWAVGEGLYSLSEWTQDDAHDFLRALFAGQVTGTAVSRSTARNYVVLLKDLRRYAPLLTSGGLSFAPWGAQTASGVTASNQGVENLTPPMPWEMWAPLIAGSWRIINEFAPDIIAAQQALLTLGTGRKGPSGANGLNALRGWVAQGGKVPLNTGVGRNTRPRGTPNFTLLARLAGFNITLFRPAHHAYQQEAVDLVHQLASDPSTSAYGGLILPAVTVEQPDGTRATWASEIGLGETEYLISVLRGACYVVIAALTGMRDSEIQELEDDATTTSDGLPALQSTQIKGREAGIGAERTWWAPQPVIAAIEVMKQIKVHAHRLFCLSTDDHGSYNAYRDLARLVEFINADPADRIGRGADLGLAPIDLTSRVPVNQRTLRRSFSILAAQHPGAELGLGIQLGHAALRTTTGYAADSQQRLVALFNDERRTIARQQAAVLIAETIPVAGKKQDEVLHLRAQIAVDDSRADAVITSLADRYHVGTFNDCMFSPEKAACGPTGPHLESQHCATLDCANAIFLARHQPTLQAQIDKIDDWLNRGQGHPAVIEQLRAERAKLAAILRQLNDSDPEEAEQ